MVVLPGVTGASDKIKFKKKNPVITPEEAIAYCPCDIEIGE